MSRGRAAAALQPRRARPRTGGASTPSDHVAEHLHEAAVGVVGEARVAARVGQALDRLVVQAEVEDRVHHAGHRDRGARAHRHQQRVGRIAEPLADALLERRPGARATCSSQAVGRPAVLAQVGDAGLGGDREAVRHGQADARSSRRGRRPCRRAAAACRPSRRRSRRPSGCSACAGLPERPAALLDQLGTARGALLDRQPRDVDHRAAEPLVQLLGRLQLLVDLRQVGVPAPEPAAIARTRRRRISASRSASIVRPTIFHGSTPNSAAGGSTPRDDRGMLARPSQPHVPPDASRSASSTCGTRRPG